MTVQSESRAHLIAPVSAALLLAAPGTMAQDGREVTVTRPGSQPSATGPAGIFTGVVRVDGRFQAADPGARTAWHTPPLGQRLIVTAGAGLVRSHGGPAQDIVKHWHGATATTGMSHIALSEVLDGRSVE